MRNKIRFYGQHTQTHCGPACVLMLLDYYEIIRYPTKKLEDTVYSHYRVNGYMGMTGAAIASCLSLPQKNLAKFLIDPEKKLDVHLVQSFEDSMENKNSLFTPEEYGCIMDSHRMHLKACENRIRFTAGASFDTEDLKEALRCGKKVILECFIPETADSPPTVLHWVILEDYDAAADLFRVRDPIPETKLLHLTAAEVDSLMNTPIGKICILVDDRPGGLKDEDKRTGDHR